jgi:hypothetical protein
MGMLKFDEKVLDVAGHTDATLASCVVAFDVNTRNFLASHVELDSVKLLENIAEMVEVFKPNILYPKVISNETELDETPFVAPEAWGGFGFIISFGKKAGLEEIVGTNAGLGKAITALANFEVNPTIMLMTLKFVFLNEFCLNVCDFNADIFRVGHGGIEVELFEIDGAETCAWAREHAVEKQLDEFKGHGVCSSITLEADAIAAVIRLNLTYHHGVANSLLFMG